MSATLLPSLTSIVATQDEHSAALRMISDRLDRLLDILTPKETDGPTLDEILAQLIAQIGDQGVILRRIDARTVEIKRTTDALALSGRARGNGLGTHAGANADANQGDRGTHK